MGKLEKESYKRSRRAYLQRAILKSVAIAGAISVAVVAPNAMQILKMLGVDKKLNRNTKQGINVSRRRLVEHGLIAYAKNGFLKLTKRGEQKLLMLEKYDYKIPHPKRWDKKWRVLIFDIPEKKRQLRDKVRLTLLSIGFKRLQDSVWVYPYDCEDLITLIKADFKIGKDLLYLIVDSIENDRSVREWFGLIEKN
ncbi:MAG: CRISPR-associated endonuclease Cas2 [bacterium]|nr:CRISPR-associated endonuclease Cas2 [bacterium]